MGLVVMEVHQVQDRQVVQLVLIQHLVSSYAPAVVDKVQQPVVAARREVLALAMKSAALVLLDRSVVLVLQLRQ